MYVARRAGEAASFLKGTCRSRLFQGLREQVPLGQQVLQVQEAGPQVLKVLRDLLDQAVLLAASVPLEQAVLARQVRPVLLVAPALEQPALLVESVPLERPVLERQEPLVLLVASVVLERQEPLVSLVASAALERQEPLVSPVASAVLERQEPLVLLARTVQ